MNFDFTLLRDWKTTLKTVIGILILLTTVFILSLPVEAVTQRKRVVVHASDGHAYEIEYTNPLSIADFYIRGLNGEVPSRQVDAELYQATKVLSQPPIQRPESLESEVKSAYHSEIDTEIVLAVTDFVAATLIGYYTSGSSWLSFGLNVVKDGGREFLEFAEKDVVLSKALMIALKFASDVKHYEAMVQDHWLVNETSINKIKAVWSAYLKAGLYDVKTREIMGDHIFSSEDPLEHILGWIPTDILRPSLSALDFLESRVLEIKEIEYLDALFETTEEEITNTAAAYVDALFGEAAINKTIAELERAGFYDRKPVEVQEEIADEWLWLPFEEDYKLLDLTNKFSDPNGDPFRLSLKEGVTDENVATVRQETYTVFGEQKAREVLAITPISLGETLVTVVATETTPFPISVEQTFKVVVAPANSPPQIIKTLSAQTLALGSSSPQLDLGTYFIDLDSASISYTAQSNNTAVATVQRTGSVITISAIGIGDATITVTATDSDSSSTEQTFTVTVDPAPVQQRPEQIGTIPTQDMTLSGGARRVDVARYFSSPNTLRYTVTASPRGFVRASISGSRVTITPLQAGSASVFVTARDSQNPDLSAIQTIPVTVRSNRPPNVDQPSDPNFIPTTTANPVVENLGNRVEIIVQNTGRLGLNIRSNPWVSNINRIGRVYDGATGKITDGPKRNGGFIWWKIDWDLENKEGWSVEAFGGSQLLFPRPPDLEIRSFNVSDDEVKPGEAFTINATVRNNGPGESPATEIFFYYQKSDENTPRVAGDGKRNVPSLRVNRSRRISLRVEAPMIPGDYEYGAILPPDIPEDYDAELVDPTRRIRLNNTDNEDVEVTSSPDLIVESISADKSIVDPGEVFHLAATVRNQGIGEPENNVTLRYYQSSNVNISSSHTEVGKDSVYRRDLDTNGTEDESISLRAPRGAGVYYYGACVDRVENESNTRNNCSGAIAITVREPAPSPTPDLVPRVPTVSANALAPGQSFTLATAVENRGTGTSGNTMLRWYRSVDPNISSTDTEVGSSSVSSLPPGQPQIHQLTLNAPVAAGTYYYGVGVEGVTDESNTTNNYSTSVAVTVENRAPSAVGTIPQQMLSENDPPTTVDVAAYFNDPNDTPLTYTAVSDNSAVATVRVSGSEITITPTGVGNASVTVTASDGTLTATQTLLVSVAAAPTENEAPVAIGVIPTQTLTLDGASSTVDISTYFSDANGDTLTYAAWPNDKTVVRLQRQGTLLTITAKAAGRATVTVRARDPEGLQAFQRISVFVSTTEVPVTELPAETWMPDANLRAAVRNALGLGPNDRLTQQTILALTSLRYPGPDLNDNQKIADLTGLEYALNLEHLDLYAHLISTLRPLAGLAKLRSLWLAGNRITNIRPLTNLPLERLDLGGNPINDFAPLAELTGLTRLDFWGNGLDNSDLDLLTGLTQLTQLDLRNNQISDIASLTQLVKLKKLQLEGNPITDTSALLNLTRQNPDLEIDIEIGEGPSAEPDREIEGEVPDLFVESVRVNKTTVDPGAVFRVDAVIKNQGKATSKAAKVHFYRSVDETITTDDTKVQTSDMPSLAADRTKNRWARLTAPDTPGVYYYGVCIGGVENENDTENNCSTAVKITVGTVVTKPPVVERPTTDPETSESLAKQVFQKHSKTLRRQDVKAVLPDVLTMLKEPDIQPLLTPDTIDRVIVDPDLLKTIVPTISDKFITLMKEDAAIKSLLSDVQAQTLLQTPAAIDELAKLLGISVAPPPAANTHWMPDANLRAAVRKALGLKPSDTLTRQAMRKLTRLEAHQSRDAAVENKIKNITGLEHATQLTTLGLDGNQISDITPLKNLTELTWLSLGGNQISDITPLKNLTKLTSLSLGGNQISDITPLKNLTKLTGWLSLEVNQISDITPLKNLTKLTNLFLYRNQISDITPLKNLTELTWLEFANNQISDITPLEGLTNLTRLRITNNPIADLAPLRRLKAKNPNMVIDIDLNAAAAPAAPVFPDETALLPNYPNPFNPETWIPYQLAEAADVTLTIYDLRGVVVRRLALGHQPAGFYHGRGRAAHWDGRNEIGEKVASSLYFYTFTADDFTATQKLLIRK